VDLKEAVLARADIAEVIGQYVALTAAGREFKGRCPFHDEKSASFHVNPEKGLFHCFGCKAGGNVIDFVMRRESLEFTEALEWLARRYNIPVEQYRGAGHQPVGAKERLYRLNEAAAQFFRKSLSAPAGEAARAYLVQRGVSERTAADFDLGYAPREWQALTDLLQSHGARGEELLTLGLVRERRSGGGPADGQHPHYDAFRHRLMFPIRSVTGRPIGFAGRALSSEDNPKYLNVTNTPLYDKSAVLYNLDRAKGLLKDEGVVIVEGYMDVIGLAAAGVNNTVAACGTALTDEHVKLLSRYTQRFYLAFDGDDAGRNAAWRAGVLFLSQGYDARVVALPTGVDPDELVRDKGAGAWAGLLAEASSLVRFWLDHQRQLKPEADLAEQRRWIAQLGPLYRRIPDELVRQQFVQDTASALRLGAPEVQGLLGSESVTAAARADRVKVRREWKTPQGNVEHALQKRVLYPRDGELVEELLSTSQQDARAREQSALGVVLRGALPIEREVLRRLASDEELLFIYSRQASPAWFASAQLREAYEALLAADNPALEAQAGPRSELFAALLAGEAWADDNEQLLRRHRQLYLLCVERQLAGELAAAQTSGDTEAERRLFTRVQELKQQMKE
jgi:DNA primase